MLRKFLVTGASGQIGQELIPYMLSRYGEGQVVVSDIRKVKYHTKDQPKFMHVDVSKFNSFKEAVKEVEPTHIVHMAALLSANAEKTVPLALKVNVEGLHNVLEIAKEMNKTVFVPSSIAAFGPDSPRDPAPDDCMTKPTTVYGITKVYAELLGTYYHKKFGVDFRSLRYPGAVSVTRPTGGTTDYATDIFYELLVHGKYTSYLQLNTRLPMMYMEDLLRGTCEFIEADTNKLTRRVYNMAALSFTPAELTEAIKKHFPNAVTTVNPDAPDVRQQYADSWPKVLDDSLARKDWGWKHTFEMDKFVEAMIAGVREELVPKLKVKEEPKEKKPKVVLTKEEEEQRKEERKEARRRRSMSLMR